MYSLNTVSYLESSKWIRLKWRLLLHGATWDPLNKDRKLIILVICYISTGHHVTCNKSVLRSDNSERLPSEPVGEDSPVAFVEGLQIQESASKQESEEFMFFFFVW